MNRPSRTDDDLEHPTWNQNPPFLAADLTTRQDLNGIANTREHRGQCAGTTSGLDHLHDEKHARDVCVCDFDNNCLLHPASAMSGRPVRPLIAGTETVLGGEGQACRSTPSIRPPSGWIGWVVSVVVASTIINVAWDFIPALFASVIKPAVPNVTRVETTLWRLAKRQDACAGSRAGTSNDYNMPLHVGALFIILGVSSLACALPMLAAKFPVLRIPKPFFFGVRHFGTGVLLATAFVHLLPTAFISLGNPCLSNFWTTDYPAMPGAIALAGIFFVSIIEMIFSPARNFTPRTPQAGDSGSGARARRSSMAGGHCGHASDVAAAITRPQTNTRRLSIETAPLQETQGNLADASKETLEIESQSGGLTEEQLHKKSILQCMLLEVGILFHSVFIGMALSVAIGGEFVVLLVAIAFHQTFEGLALGARIASITWPKDTLQPWLMVVAYGCTTPIGQAIGLATHTLYSPDSEFGLILVGTMNAVSSGLLVFAALIELLAEDFLSDHSWSVLRGRKRAAACLLVLFGAACMSLVGAWA
ncbi:Zinc-regulated transporter 2 [Madurella mycetomatis]|uniref:Zinc-regulated transporter 2 n=1 Tax=Madurella mycetomatis TaxID=100816 RepID=A0A175WFR2_9PEZI|nr:Zinc-regulated transporter 2 [Madurella mycetomatis]